MQLPEYNEGFVGWKMDELDESDDFCLKLPCSNGGNCWQNIANVNMIKRARERLSSDAIKNKLNNSWGMRMWDFAYAIRC